jgi:hypothetical protein
MYLSLDDVKLHLNIELEYAGDDRYIVSLIEAAEDIVSRDLNIDFSRCFVAEADIPQGIRQQIKILVATMYNNREGVGNGVPLPLSYNYLSGLYRNFDFDSYYAIGNKKYDRRRENE